MQPRLHPYPEIGKHYTDNHSPMLIANRHPLPRLIIYATVLIAVFSLNATGVLAAVDWRAKWMTSYHKAKQLAGKEKKPLLLVFTDRQGCENCSKLEGSVFATTVFADWANESAILMRVDLSEAALATPDGKQYLKLKEQFAVEQLPVVHFLDSEGESHGRLDYLEGDSMTWIQAAEGVIDTMPKPPVVEPHTHYRRARSQAAVKNLPMLIIVHDNSSPRVTQKIEMLYQYQKMIDLVEAGLVVVELKWPEEDKTSKGEGGSNSEDKSGKPLFDGFADQQELKRKPIEIFVIESRSGKVIYRTAAPPNPGKLVSQIMRAMPGLTYKGEWLTNFNLAQQISMQTERPLLIFFGGMSWNRWTKQLQSEIFNTRQFKDYAKKRLVLVYLDYPQPVKRTTKGTPQNEALKQQYSVRGLPTLILVNTQGAEITRMGYMAGGSESFIKRLDQWIQN